MQIGSTWVVTAAHCLYENGPDEDGYMVDVKYLSVLLGLHDRSKKSEPYRLHKCHVSFSCFHYLFRRQIRVDEVFVHEDFNATFSEGNDIALLLLGFKHYLRRTLLLEKKP